VPPRLPACAVSIVSLLGPTACAPRGALLVESDRVAGARRFVAQSFAGWPFAREGGPVKAEEDPLDPNPPMPARQTIAAIREVEAMVTGANDLEGIVLRYGFFCFGSVGRFSLLYRAYCAGWPKQWPGTHFPFA